MRIDRLEMLKTCAQPYRAAGLPSPAWVWYDRVDVMVPGVISELPVGAVPSAAGLLPSAFPESWCWVVEAWEDGLEIVPIYKGATMWTQLSPLMNRRGSQMLAASLWRQVAEWFETSAQVCQSTYKLGGSCCEFLACN